MPDLHGRIRCDYCRRNAPLGDTSPCPKREGGEPCSPGDDEGGAYEAMVQRHAQLFAASRRIEHRLTAEVEQLRAGALAEQERLAKLVQQKHDEVEKLRAALSRVRTLLSEWSDLGKAHEYGCGNGRPCDACEVDELLALAGDK
jgi:hypothetical protein